MKNKDFTNAARNVVIDEQHITKLKEHLEKAEKKLNNYIQKYYDSAKDCLLRYAREQQKLITPEANEWNLIREKLNNEVIGIKWTHKVSDPKPAPMPMLPEGLGRTGN